MLKEIEVLCHNSIRIKNNNLVIYIDPYNVNNKFNDVDYIFYTYLHYDHFFRERYQKSKKEKITITTTFDTFDKAINLELNK